MNKKALETLRQLIQENSLEYADNFRVCKVGDPEGEQAYMDKQQNGCCGSFDREVTIDGEAWMVGCNHGH